MSCLLQNGKGRRGCGQKLRLLTRQGDVHVFKRRKNESNKALYKV